MFYYVNYLQINNYFIRDFDTFYNLMAKHVRNYPTPSNLNYCWSFGSLVGLFFGIQVLSGIFLAMYYVSDVQLAFYSVEYIMRDVPYGWFVRYVHSNGASFVFIFLYLHMLRGLYYNLYENYNKALWFSGVILFILMMATAFLGYVLPWGQMSFWGATVITNLLSAVPYVGESLVYWIWGGYAVDNATLHRFFALHFFLPFFITGLIFIHLAILHDEGSSGPIMSDISRDNIAFWPYFALKDAFVFSTVLVAFAYLVFFDPNLLGHCDNYCEADPLVTPPHIVPEWYFLPFYAMLRGIPNKLVGVCVMVLSLLVLFLLPFLSQPVMVKSNRFRPIRRIIFWSFVGVFVALMLLGAKPPVYPYVILSNIMTLLYFLTLFLLTL